jgi:hypothetical protein
MKKIDLKKSVYQLTAQYPELIDILTGLGFLGVKNAIARETLGRMTTIPQGCERMGIALDQVKAALKQKGFEVTGNQG